jgi:hypothetical protein
MMTEFYVLFGWDGVNSVHHLTVRRPRSGTQVYISEADKKRLKGIPCDQWALSGGKIVVRPEGELPKKASRLVERVAFSSLGAGAAAAAAYFLV